MAKTFSAPPFRRDTTSLAYPLPVISDQSLSENKNKSFYIYPFPVVRHSAACLSPSSDQAELYLDCSNIGVVNVLTAEFGRQPTGGDSDHCAYQVTPPCAADASSASDLLTRCMGATSCNVPVTPQPMPSCAGGATSDYLQVKYQCVPGMYKYCFSYALFLMFIVYLSTLSSQCVPWKINCM